MSTLRNLEGLFFHFGFRKCVRDESINFRKINENEYLVFRIFKDAVADLLLEKYETGKTPCDSKPNSDKTIKLGFEKENDIEMLHEFITKSTFKNQP